MTNKDLASKLGITEQMVGRYRRAGMPVNDLEAAKVWKSANVRMRATPGAKRETKAGKRDTKRQPRVTVPPVSDYQNARTQLAIAEARDAQLRLLERQGVLVHVEVQQKRMAQLLSGLRDAFLQIPARLQAQLAAELEESKCHDLVQDEIFRVLGQLTAEP